MTISIEENRSHLRHFMECEALAHEESARRCSTIGWINIAEAEAAQAKFIRKHMGLIEEFWAL